MIKKLLKLSDQLDRKGLHKEADFLDQIIKVANKEKYTKEQLETFDKDKSNPPYSKSDFEMLRENKADDGSLKLKDGLISCPNCGTLNDPENKNCTHCDFDLTGINKLWVSQKIIY